MQVHRDNGLRARGDRGSDRCSVDRPGAGLDVDENRSGTGELDGPDGRHESERDRDHLIARSDFARRQSKVQCRRAGIDRHRMRGLAIAREIALERFDLTPQAVASGSQDTDRRLFELFAQRGVL